MRATPDVGIATYNYAVGDLLNLARYAERLGFEGIWLGEHYASPRAYAGHHPSRKETPADHNDPRDKAIIGEEVRIYDPWALLGAVAAVTRRLKIGTAICIVPMMHPLSLARATATVHDLSQGRFLLGTGAGWLREEFDALGIPFNERGALLDESIEILRRSWEGGFFSYEGKYFRFDELQISPHPVRVPLVCGGNTGPALRRVGQVADAWINSAQVSLEEAIGMRETIESARRSFGTEGRPFDYYVRPHTADPAQVEAFVDAGFTKVLLRAADVWPNDPAVSLEAKVRQIEGVARSLGLKPAEDVAA